MRSLLALSILGALASQPLDESRHRDQRPLPSNKTKNERDTAKKKRKAAKASKRRNKR